MNRLLKLGVGGIFFLLPLFFLLPPLANTIDAQLMTSKFLLCFFLGNALFSAFIVSRGQSYLGLVHGLISLSVLHSVLGVNQLYPYMYWLAALGAALGFLLLDSRAQKMCLKAVVYAAVASSVLAMFQAMDLDPILSYAPNITEADRRLPAGMMGQATKHGAFLAIALGMALGFRLWFAVALIAAGVLLTNSSFTWLSAAGAVLVWARYEWGRGVVVKLSLAGVLGVVVLFLLGSSLTISHGRFDVWEAALLAWWNGPALMGFGLGSFAAATGPEQTLFAQHFQPEHLKIYGDFLHAHNDYVQVIFEAGVLGIIGIVAGVYFVGSYYCRVWWKSEVNRQVVVAAECGLVAILLNALGNFPFQLAPHYLLAVIFVALLMDKTNKGYNKL